MGDMDPVRPEDAGGFVPTVSEEYAGQIRLWHERAYRERRSAKGSHEQTFDYLGLTIVVTPEVMPVTPVSHLLGEAVLAQVLDGDRDLGHGHRAGSQRGSESPPPGAPRYWRSGTNPRALDAARGNAARRTTASPDRPIDVRYSDVFSEVEGTFDLIVFDPPFRWFRPRDPPSRRP